MAAKVWSGVAIAVQSALATAVTISAITKANPAVVSWASGTDPANGDYVLLKIQGMSQLDYRVVRVTFSDSTKVLFAGYVGATNFPTGSAQQKVSTPISFNVYGRTTAYAT